MRKRVFGYNDRMEFFLTDPDIERLPPADTRLLDLRAEPYPDGKRLRVALDLTPFQQKPYLELTLPDSAGEVVAATSIVEPVAWRLELTLHILKPGATAGEVYKLTVILSFPDLGEIDRRDLTVEIPFPTV
ncbi:MAG: hypothetical protein Q8N46_05625 [Anaerolineales bacterium]|nr:hypothetical protein [Anaerolineales bacterium]